MLLYSSYGGAFFCGGNQDGNTNGREEGLSSCTDRQAEKYGREK